MKKLLILFMPFFMVGCDTEKQPSWQALAQRDSMVSLFGQLQQRVATNDTAAIRQLGDSLGKLGQRYRWTGQADVGDSGFRDYILLNSEIESRLWDEPIKNRPLAVQFSANILPHESVLATDTALLGLWAQSLYRHTSPRAAHKYDEPVVMAFEKYLHCQNRLTGPAEKAVLAQRHFNVLQHLGIAYHILGEKKQADQYYRTALQAAVETEEAPDNTASAYINLLGFWAEYKHYDSIVKNIPVALQSIGALEADTKKKADAKRRAMFSAYYAEALYEKGNAAYALQLRQASDSLNKISAQKVDADILAKKSDILKLQGDIDFKQKRYPSAVRFYQQALNTCLQKNLANNAPPHDRSYAKLLLCLANVHDSLGQTDTALRCSQFALACVTPVDSADIAQNPAPHDLYTENTILEALDAKAGLLLKKQAAQGDTALLQNAVQCFERAFAVEQKLLANFTYDDSRAELQVQTNSKERSARAIQACYQLYQLTGRPYWAEKAFLFSESSKALILLEAIKKNLNLGRYKNNPLFKQVDSLQLQLAYAEQQLLHDTNDSAAALLRKERLGNELDMALKALYASEPSYKNYRQQQDTALLANLRQKLLTPQRCLAEFFCNGNNNYLFVIRQNGALVFERLDSSLRSEVDSLMGYFTGSGPLEPPQYARVAFRLFQTCRLPTVLTAQELLLIPDGDLNRIPFDALVTDNANDGFKKLPYLFQSATTSYGYSAASLLQQPNSQVNIRQITAFAPVFKNGERGFQPLLKSETEVNSIGAQPVYLGPSATTDKLRNSFNEADIIHIATHASASSGNNANPCIEMYDGAFCLNELYAIPMRQISLVVLSACQTNQGNIDQSEGTLSLARGCYYAGAQNIVASLWKVDDASTAAIMQQFYANSGNGQYAVSLRKARQQYLREVMPGGNTAPYYWAALMHIGGFGKATDSNKNMGYGMAVLGLAILCGGAWLLWRKRRRY